MRFGHFCSGACHSLLRSNRLLHRTCHPAPSALAAGSCRRRQARGAPAASPSSWLRAIRSQGRDPAARSRLQRELRLPRSAIKAVGAQSWGRRLRRPFTPLRFFSPLSTQSPWLTRRWAPLSGEGTCSSAHAGCPWLQQAICGHVRCQHAVAGSPSPLAAARSPHQALRPAAARLLAVGGPPGSCTSRIGFPGGGGRLQQRSRNAAAARRRSVQAGTALRPCGRPLAPRCAERHSTAKQLLQ